MKKYIAILTISMISYAGLIEAYAAPSSFSSSRSASSTSRFSSSSKSPSRFSTRMSEINKTTATPKDTVVSKQKYYSDDNRGYVAKSTDTTSVKSTKYTYTAPAVPAVPAVKKSVDSTKSNSSTGTAVAIAASVAALALLASSGTHANTSASSDTHSTTPASSPVAQVETPPQPTAAERRAIQEQKIKDEKEAWNAMTPKERESIAIKKLWISKCKEWMCMN